MDGPQHRLSCGGVPQMEYHERKSAPSAERLIVALPQGGIEARESSVQHVTRPLQQRGPLMA
jgi:hypothetical protein